MLFVDILQTLTVNHFGYKKVQQGEYKHALIYFSTLGLFFTGSFIDFFVENFFDNNKNILQIKKKIEFLLFFFVIRNLFLNDIINYCLLFYLMGELKPKLGKSDLLEFINLFLFCAICVIMENRENKFESFVKLKNSFFILYLIYIEMSYEQFFKFINWNIFLPTNIILIIWKLIVFLLKIMFNYSLLNYLSSHAFVLTLLIGFDFEYESPKNFKLEEIRNIVIIFAFRAWFQNYI